MNGEQPDKNHVYIYGRNDKILFKNVYITITKLSKLSKLLSTDNFEKINQSTIINLSHLKERDNTIISLYDSKETFEVTAKEKIGFVGKLRAKFRI
ncbi:LytTR family transcriptional regulator DNA-binding domain-containing protein [Psychroserpens sp. Hel_I_66]|uniref:LytTR family transcriptional regulator DNA-binding domain-containing protein n=1 Tax=Psychroserpens sp. Hel_I_66 TaxID=1250004 RepID=UPI00397C44A8